MSAPEMSAEADDAMLAVRLRLAGAQEEEAEEAPPEAPPGHRRQRLRF